LQATPANPVHSSPRNLKDKITLRPFVLIPSNFQIVQAQEKYTAEVSAARAVAEVVGALRASTEAGSFVNPELKLAA
jgi:hypothetical protein